MSDRQSSIPGGSGPGSVVLRGKIKVDARKALDKLRDHMLTDHHLYACEIARVAVGMGATELDIDYDADDVLFELGGGHLLPIEAIARVRDHVLTKSEGAGLDADALHALGVGVSAALGLDPSFVDIYRAPADSQGCERVRFERKHIEDGGDVAIEDVPTPVRIPSRPSMMKRKHGTDAMLVHVRARLGLGVLSRAVKKDVPREISLLARAANDAPLAIRLRGEPIDRRPANVVLRVELDEPSVTRATLEVLRFDTNASADAGIIFLERGIRLAAYPMPDCWRMHREGAAALPFRVVIDMTKLPTNASRSEVRMDAVAIERVRARIPVAFGVAMSALESIVIRGVESPNTGGHVVHVLGDRKDLTDVFGAIVSEAALAIRAGVVTMLEAKALLALPILTDVLGKPMSLVDLRGGTDSQTPLLVYTGEGPPFSDALSRWIGGIMWSRGATVERALTGLHLASANGLVAQAHESCARRNRALAHPPTRPMLPQSNPYIVRESFVVKEGPFSGLEGQIGIVQRAGGQPRHSPTARLFVDDRLLETTQLSGVSLPIDMALSWPNGIIARFQYDAVERNDSLSRALLYALRLAAIAIAERKVSEERRDPEMIQLAIMAWASASQTLGDAKIDAATLGALAKEPAWPTSMPGVMVSFAEIDAYARRTSAICTAFVGSGQAPDDRPVVDSKLLAPLRALLPTTRFVAYERYLAQPPNASRDALAKESTGLPAVAIHHPKVDGFITIGGNRRKVYHAGICLLDEPYLSRNGPVTIIINDRGAIPTPEHKGLAWSTPLAGLARDEDALVEVIIGDCERGTLEMSPTVKEYIDTATRKLRARSTGMKHDDENKRAVISLAQKLAELPAKIEKRRRQLQRQVILARAPANLDEILGVGSIRGSTKAGVGDGEVTVAPARDRLRAEVLFDGHPLFSTFICSLPVVAVVNVRRESLLNDDWSALTAEGTQWAKMCIIDAGLHAMGVLAQTDGFASNALALDLWLALTEEVQMRAFIYLGQSRWPTVQGGVMKLPVEPGPLPVGTQAYASYRDAEHSDASPFDAPAVYLPRDWLGDLRRRVLSAAGFYMTDVTDPIARLQARRTRGVRTPPPKLTGAPAHPLLRSSLADLGVTHAEGEIELIDGTSSAPSVIRVADSAGGSEAMPFTLQFPARIIYRSDDASSNAALAHSAVMSEIASALVKFVRRLATRLDEVPLFVRDRLRALIVSSRAEKNAVRDMADDGMLVFLDTAGRWHSLNELMGLAVVRTTADGPPWIDARAAGLGEVIHLSSSEWHALANVVKFEDVTQKLRAYARGAARRAVPPLDRIELAPEMRAKCMFIIVLDQDGVRGELGLLHPANESARGILLHTTRRPLVRIEDPEGWPVIGVLDDDNARPTPGFDGLAETKDLSRIQAVIRVAIGTKLATFLEAPANVRGVMRLTSPFLVRGAPTPSTSRRVVACMGVFWVDHVWPEIPEVHVEGIGVVDPYRTPLIPQEDAVYVAGAGAVVHHRLLPIRGRVWVTADGRGLDAALDEVFRWVKQRLPPILRSTTHRVGKNVSPEENERFAWDLVLAGIAIDDTKDPLKELATDRPNSALVHVAARRTPHLMVRTEQDARAAAATPPRKVLSEELKDAVYEVEQWRAEQRSAQTPPQEEQHEGQTFEHVGAEVEEEGDRPSFLGGLFRRVVSLVSMAPADPAEERSASPTGPFTQALGASLGAIKLSGDPVRSVVESRRGRPIAFDKDTGRVIVNIEHDAIRALENHPSGQLFALTAAISEINRELVPVTDAEEIAIVLDLLRANETADGGSGTSGTSGTSGAPLLGDAKNGE